MITQTKLPHPRQLEDCALDGSTQSYHSDTTKKTGADPNAGEEKEASAQHVKREQSVVPELDRNTRQRKGDPKW
jgi:hypothetical protein